MTAERPRPPSRHIRLTSHPGRSADVRPIRWGAPEPAERGPIIAGGDRRNAIGTFSGAFAIYRALAVASGALAPDHRSDLRDTAPVTEIGPHPSWGEPERIVSLDPWGARVGEVFADRIAAGDDIRPTIAITRARIGLPEIVEATRAGRIVPDGRVLHDDGSVSVVKAAVEPVWWLPGVAARFDLDEADLRRALFEHTGGMYPELVTRPDLSVFLPPIGGHTVYLFGEPSALGDPAVRVTARVHDECNGSDVFGSDICTCRPYLVHGIEECIATASAGGVGVVVYNRKEGRALGEVTKFLVYNARKRQPGGDVAAEYFTRTECVAGVQDVRFQELMPDVLHWLGITRIDRFVSMSDEKHGAIVRAGIEIGERIPIPTDRIPADAHVEIEAKKAAGYYSEGPRPDPGTLRRVRGRDLDA